MDLKGMGWKRVDCCNLVNDKNQWLVRVNVIIKLRMTSTEATIFSEKIGPYGVSSFAWIKHLPVREE